MSQVHPIYANLSMLTSATPKLTCCACATNTYDAALGAARLRFRPIIMTSLAFYIGRSSARLEHRGGRGKPLLDGTGVIGGILPATFIAVLLISLFYVLLTSRKEPSTANEPESGPAHAEPVKGSGS